MTLRNRDGMTLGGSATQRAKLPAINIPPNIDGQLRVTLEAMKERLEVREGSRGNPFERVATMRDLEALSQVKATTTTLQESGTAEGGLTPEQARKIFNDAMAAESARLRGAIATTERNLNNAMNSLVNGDGDGGISALQAMAYSAVNTYTQTQLADDLANGAATIFAGATAGNTVMELDPAGNYVLFRHKDANINAAPGGAPYGGVVRTAVGITAAGFVAGFNKQSDGSWQNSVVIDSATGNVTILGTLKAGSVIEAGATIGVGGTPIGDVALDAAQAVIDAESALTAVAGKLDAQATYILGSDFSLKTSGYDGGTGVAITSGGILGKKAGATTFTLTNAGSATFSGDVVTGGDAQFSGKSTTTRSLIVDGVAYSVDYSMWADATTNATSAAYLRAGVIGYANAVTAAWNVGVSGSAPSTTKGVGVVGNGGYAGGFFTSTSATGYGLIARNEDGGFALATNGPSSLQGNVSVTGAITATGNVTAYSDLRLKEDLQTIGSALDKVRQLTGYTFTRKDTGERQTGLVAQDVQAVLPEAVQEGEYLSVAYGNLIGLLVEAIKELDRKVNP